MPLIDQEIVELNLFWLVKAREFARENRQKAVVVLGLDNDLADKLSSLSIDDLNRIAHAGVLLFRPRFRPTLWQQLIARGSKSSLSIRLHTLLMAAGEKCD
ncbi:MAG: flagellar transcriptional regulator FlhD [Gammaproteobacteria bacterium]|nr:flagellar transcriptional regulator FlhD [Gammaproteobacteria bacterium]